MATYKVIQDIEAEDKLLGPLTLRQFIYAGIAAILLYLSFLMVTNGLAPAVVLFLPFAGAFAFLAFPWRRDQPTEIWALAKVRFLIKPRKRVWDQSGFKELVTITVPKMIHIDYTNGLSQNEVRSRLQALAQTVDSRGWAVKNANVNMFSQPALVMGQPSTDRLMGPLSLPQQVSNVDVQASDDIMDEKNNATAQKVDSMINATAKAHRQKLLDAMQQETPPEPPPAQPANYWFMNQPDQPVSAPAGSVTFNTQVVTPGAPPVDDLSALPPKPTNEEQQLLQTLEAQKSNSPSSSYYGHLHTIEPLSQKHTAPAPTMQAMAQQAQPAPPVPMAPPPMPRSQPMVPTMQTQAPAPTPQPAPQPAPPPVTPTQQAAILQLARNDDLNVATLAREAHRSDASQGEVVINLH